MEYVPISFIEELQSGLPPVKEYPDTFICKEFDFDNKHYALYFYKVNERGNEFWLCNPYNVIQVTINGSHSF